MITGAAKCLFRRDNRVVAVGLYDANLVGADFLIYAKFVNVSDSWIKGLLREEYVFSERLGVDGALQAPRGQVRDLLHTEVVL